MTIRPGKNLVRGIALLGLLSPLTLVWKSVFFLLAVALVALICAAVVERRWLKRALAGLKPQRTLPVVVGRDTLFQIELTLTNENSFPLSGTARDERPSAAVPQLELRSFALAGQETIQFLLTCRIPQRGKFQFGAVWGRIEGPWRLLEAQKAWELCDTLKVYPDTFASPERLQKDLGAELRLLELAQRARHQGAGTEFESLYPFRQGDDPKRIDWRATARLRTPVVRRFQVERHRDVMILVDAGRLMGADGGRGTKLDCAVDAALHLARVVLQSGDRCGLAIYDCHVRGYVPPLCGHLALHSLLDCVYDLQIQWVESDFIPLLTELRRRRAKRTFFIVLSDLNDAETSHRLSAALLQLQHHHLVLFAALQTPLLRQTVRWTAQEPLEIAKQAVAFRLLGERGRALHALRHSGIHVLDVEPNHLTLPLINRFIDLRQRNLL